MPHDPPQIDIEDLVVRQKVKSVMGIMARDDHVVKKFYRYRDLMKLRRYQI